MTSLGSVVQQQASYWANRIPSWCLQDIYAWFGQSHQDLPPEMCFSPTAESLGSSGTLLRTLNPSHENPEPYWEVGNPARNLAGFPRREIQRKTAPTCAETFTMAELRLLIYSSREGSWWGSRKGFQQLQIGSGYQQVADRVPDMVPNRIRNEGSRYVLNSNRFPTTPPTGPHSVPDTNSKQVVTKVPNKTWFPVVARSE